MRIYLSTFAIYNIRQSSIYKTFALRKSRNCSTPSGSRDRALLVWNFGEPQAALRFQAAYFSTRCRRDVMHMLSFDCA